MTDNANPKLCEDTFYQLRSPTVVFSGDCVDGRKRFVLSRDDYAYCKGFVTRGRQRFAELLHQTDEGDRVTLYLRVSRFNRGVAHWQVLNPMKVIALADVLALD